MKMNRRHLPFLPTRAVSSFLVLISLLALNSPAVAQNPPAATSAAQSPTTQHPAASQSVNGMATGVPAAAQFDSQHRPITAGGFVKTGPIVFMDTAAQAGLTQVASRRRRAGEAPHP